MAHSLLSRPALACYVFGVLVALPYALPENLVFASWGPDQSIGVKNLRVLTPRTPPSHAAPREEPPPTVGETEVGPTDDTGANSEVVSPVAKGPIAKAPAPVDTSDLPKNDRPIEDFTGTSLDGFFAALQKVEAKEPGAMARITYYGDSVILTDWVTATLRRKLQQKYGDGGHGFVLPADGWTGYHHDDIVRYASKGWKVSRVVGPWNEDAHYGLGGVSFIGAPGSMSQFGTTTSGDYGRSVSKFTLTYAEMPGGGDIALSLDGAPAQMIPTAADKLNVKSVTVSAPDGPHKLELRNGGKGMIRVFGMELEREGPGVVLDSIGILGCRLRFLDKNDDEHWATELKRRNPSLVVFHYGANESEDNFKYPMDQYEETAKAVIGQMKKALPNAACLVVSNMDRARGDGTAEITPVLNKSQRNVAEAMGCGFFNTFQAMGGPGSMAVWMRKGLGGADSIHPTIMGGDVIAGWLYDALLLQFEAYKRRTANNGAAPRLPPKVCFHGDTLNPRNSGILCQRMSLSA